MDLLELGREQKASIMAQLQVGRPVMLGQGRAQSHILRQVADALGDAAILVRIEYDLDAGFYVPLLIADQCGADVRATAQRLLAPAGQPDGWQDMLDRALSGRLLVVDGLARLRPGRAEWDLPGVFARASRALSDWLESRAAIATLEEEPRYELRPRPDPRWAATHLWDLVERDPERYTLAVAREILLGRGEGRGWDHASLIIDLWDGMSTELRELVASLAVQGRPIQRSLFERLELVSTDTIDRARDLALIELHAGQLSLPTPWYGEIQRLDPVARHRLLAEAFARVARSERGEASPLAVLEAHRHYAAIPDIERALEFADFSVGPLLETAINQSQRGERVEAAECYEALLQLEARNPGRLGPRTRAYACHYLHYNRARAGGETIQQTVAGYRAALVDWSENALFWSRLVRALFEARDEAEAMKALRDAYAHVRPHSERDRALVVHTADRLMVRGLFVPAVFVWGEHRSRSEGDRDVEARLNARLARGWRTERLWANGLPAVDAESPVQIRAMPHIEEGYWESASGELRRRGPTRGDAVRGLMRALIFDVLATRWRQETGGLSISRLRHEHPAWQQILSLGPEVVPEILRRIEREPDHWHTGLVQLTGENPIPVGERITVSQGCARWVEWGRKRGLQW